MWTDSNTYKLFIVPLSILILSVLGFGFSYISSKSINNPNHDFQLAQWQRLTPDNYTYNVRYNCGYGSGAEYNVLSIHSSDKFELKDNEHRAGTHTIKTLFQLIKDSKYAAKLNVSYNPQYGYPEHISLDRDSHILDDECVYQVYNFEVLDAT
jgi:hypothetical protein